MEIPLKFPTSKSPSSATPLAVPESRPQPDRASVVRPEEATRPATVSKQERAI